MARVCFFVVYSYFCVVGIVCSWQRRWFVLCNGTLFYFQNAGDIDPKGFIPVENVFASSNKKQITLTPRKGSYVKSAKFDKDGGMLIGNHMTVLLQASSEREAAEWAHLIGETKH